MTGKMLKIDSGEWCMALVLCLLLAAGTVGFTLFVREQDIPPAPVEDPELKHLEARRQVLYDNLKDLQFEYHQGKLTDQDYQSLKQGFLYDLAGVMDSIERIGLRPGKHPKSARKSGSVAEDARSKSKATATAPTLKDCPACKAANPLSNRFCGKCGQPLPS
jgi:hypothetical protein